MPTALPNQFEQTTSRVLVVLMQLKVFDELIDAGGQQRNLYLWRTGVLGVAMILLYDRIFFTLA